MGSARGRKPRVVETMKADMDSSLGFVSERMLKDDNCRFPDILDRQMKCVEVCRLEGVCKLWKTLNIEPETTKKARFEQDILRGRNTSGLKYSGLALHQDVTER